MDRKKKAGVIAFLVGFIICFVTVAVVGYYFLYVDNKIEDRIEKIERAKHSENDIVVRTEKVNIYLFWGNGCGHCSNLKTFFATIEDDYGKYYNLYAFEVWGDASNKKLMDNMAAVMGDGTLKGVPYLVIGEKSFKGYSPTMDKSIINAIMSEYNSDTRYDAYELIK